jgi:hypothetical protein
MGLRPTHGDENRISKATVDSKWVPGDFRRSAIEI